MSASAELEVSSVNALVTLKLLLVPDSPLPAAVSATVVPGTVTVTEPLQTPYVNGPMVAGLIVPAEYVKVGVPV